MNQVEKELLNNLKSESINIPTFVESRKDLLRVILELCETIFSHTIKVLFYPNDINQNKWRNEICSKYVLINQSISKSNNKKFKESDYAYFFDHYATSIKEWELRVSAILDGLQKYGYKPINYTGELYISTYQTYRTLRAEILKIFTDKNKVTWNRDSFREIIDKVVGK